MANYFNNIIIGYTINSETSSQSNSLIISYPGSVVVDIDYSQSANICIGGSNQSSSNNLSIIGGQLTNGEFPLNTSYIFLGGISTNSSTKGSNNTLNLSSSGTINLDYTYVLSSGNSINITDYGYFILGINFYILYGSSNSVNISDYSYLHCYKMFIGDQQNSSKGNTINISNNSYLWNQNNNGIGTNAVVSSSNVININNNGFLCAENFILGQYGSDNTINVTSNSAYATYIYNLNPTVFASGLNTIGNFYVSDSNNVTTNNNVIITDSTWYSYSLNGSTNTIFVGNLNGANGNIILNGTGEITSECNILGNTYISPLLINIYNGSIYINNTNTEAPFEFLTTLCLGTNGTTNAGLYLPTNYSIYTLVLYLGANSSIKNLTPNQSITVSNFNSDSSATNNVGFSENISLDNSPHEFINYSASTNSF
ncbi:MAG: hypothetical protein K9M81_02900 [Chthoniobacterales bacterium]|nr:hypothetical protein [Chthoniobacterales bacterium]